MTTITEPAFIAALAERGVTVNRSQVNQFRPVADKRGDCHQYGEGRRSVWLWEPWAADVWADYLRGRAMLIESHAIGWHSKRKYKAEDVEAVREWLFTLSLEQEPASEAQQQQEVSA